MEREEEKEEARRKTGENRQGGIQQGTIPVDVGSAGAEKGEGREKEKKKKEKKMMNE